VSERSTSEGALKPEAAELKPTPVSSPTATGGAGNVFEHAVGAYWLAQLLLGAIPPILIDCNLTQVHFQTEHLGWCTDDFLVIGQSSSSISRKLAGQVKRRFTIGPGR
jgi:hypothetical protein